MSKPEDSAGESTREPGQAGTGEGGSATDTSDKGTSQAKPDYEKSYKELQSTYSKTTEALKAAEEKARKLEEQLAASAKAPETTSGAGASGTPKTDNDGLEGQIATLESRVAELKQGGYDTVAEEATLTVLKREHRKEINERFRERELGDLKNFYDNHKDEIDVAYSIEELVAIKNEKAKSGRDIDLESARGILIGRNQEAFSQKLAEGRARRETARTQPETKGTVTEPEKPGNTALDLRKAVWGV